MLKITKELQVNHLLVAKHVHGNAVLCLVISKTFLNGNFELKRQNIKKTKQKKTLNGERAPPKPSTNAQWLGTVLFAFLQAINIRVPLNFH